MSADFYIVNLSHARPSMRYVTFWRPDCKGYAYPLSWSGRYPEARVREQLDYFNSGANVAVPCSVVEALSEAPTPGDIDDDAGPVVRSTRENWMQLLAHVIEPPTYKPVPVWFGKRRPKREALER